MQVRDIIYLCQIRPKFVEHYTCFVDVFWCFVGQIAIERITALG